MQEFPQDALLPPTRLYSELQTDLLRHFAARYIWWKTPQEAFLYPESLLAQVMNIGTFEDLSGLLTVFTAEELRRVVNHPEPGWFTTRSWAFWHVRLGLIPIGALLPPLPMRTFPD